MTGGTDSGAFLEPAELDTPSPAGADLDEMARDHGALAEGGSGAIQGVREEVARFEARFVSRRPHRPDRWSCYPRRSCVTMTLRCEPRSDPTAPIQMMNRSIFAAAALTLVACQSTSVQTFSSPEEATRAIIAAAETGDGREASRIFDTFARSSVHRDQVFVELSDAGVSRYEDGRYRAAAGVFAFLCERYPGALSAKESLVYALLLQRGVSGSADPGLSVELEGAVADVRGASETPAPWVDLAAALVAADAGDLARARESFAVFIGGWEGEPAALTIQVEELGRRLETD